MEVKLADCTVRTLRTTDAESLAQHANDPRIAAQLRDRFPHPYSIADATAFCRALEKAGFLLEGTLRRSAIKAGIIRDQRMYARLR